MTAVQLVESPRNGGFSAGHNIGIQTVEADYYLLLNSDTYLRPKAIPRLLTVADAAPDVGILSPRLEWPDGTPQTSCFRFHTPISELINAAATGPVTRLLRHWNVPMPIPTEAVDVPWTSFAAAILRGATRDAIGPMDEGFFMYYEDVDTCRRVRRAGWRIRYEPSARVVHLRGQSSSVKSDTAARRRRPGYYYASRRHYYRRAFGLLGPMLANTCWTIGHGIARCRERFGKKQPHAVAHELIDVWRTRT